MLDVIRRCALKNDSLGSEFQFSTTFGGGAKEAVSISCFDFWANMIITFPFWGGEQETVLQWCWVGSMLGLLTKVTLPSVAMAVVTAVTAPVKYCFL